MSSSVSFTVTGLKEAAAFTRKVSESVRPITEQVIEEMLQAMVDYAKAIVPVDTGFLQRSIDWVAAGPNEWFFRAKAGYATYVELGTSKQRAQPFMQPAVDAVLDQVQGKTDDAFADLIGAP